MNPSTRQALDLLREGTDAPVSGEREARIRAGIEASVGLALPVAIVPVAAPVLVPAVKAGAGVAKLLVGSSLGQTVLVAMASVAVGSGATLAIRELTRPSVPTAGSIQGRVVMPKAVPAPLRAVELAPPALELAAALAVDDAPAREDGPSPAPTPVAVAHLAGTPVGARALSPSDPSTPSIPAAVTGSTGLPPPVAPFSAPPLISAEVPRCTRAMELQTVKAAQQAFTDEQPQRALEVLDRQHAQCPTGEWSPMSWTLRIRALCGLERHAEAQGLMSWYWADHPKDARFAAAELREVCPAPVIAAPSERSR